MTLGRAMDLVAEVFGEVVEIDKTDDMSVFTERQFVALADACVALACAMVSIGDLITEGGES